MYLIALKSANGEGSAAAVEQADNTAVSTAAISLGAGRKVFYYCS